MSTVWGVHGFARVQTFCTLAYHRKLVLDGKKIRRHCFIFLQRLEIYCLYCAQVAAVGQALSSLTELDQRLRADQPSEAALRVADEIMQVLHTHAGLQIRGSKFRSSNSNSRELELTNLLRLVLGCTSSGARPQARASGGTCPHND